MTGRKFNIYYGALQAIFMGIFFYVPKRHAAPSSFRPGTAVLHGKICILLGNWLGDPTTEYELSVKVYRIIIQCRPHRRRNTKTRDKYNVQRYYNLHRVRILNV